MLNFAKLLLDLIIPPRCAMCAKVVASPHTLCPDCFAKLEFITAPICKVCGLPLDISERHEMICARCAAVSKTYFDFARAAVIYNDASRKIISDFKYYDKTELVKIMAKFIYAIAGIDYAKFDFIIPVPIHKDRLRLRKYNQAALLAKELSSLINKPYYVNLLVKEKATLTQAELNYSLRQKNIKNSFSVTNPTKIKGAKIILIDDVITTGATMNECAKVLKKAGAQEVMGLAFAHTTIIL